jgi:RNA polymerase sigma-70 factor (ECF subfamily)
MIKESHDESHLVLLLKKRDRNVLEYLYDHYHRPLLALIMDVVKDEEIARDTLQEVFVKIWKHADRYDHTKGRLYTWMLNIARNSGIDATRSQHYRASRKIQSASDFVDSTDQQFQISMNTDSIGLKDVVQKLNPEHSRLIDLAYFDGYTQEEIARKLNLPLGTVKTRIRIAVRELRNLLGAAQGSGNR